MVLDVPLMRGKERWKESAEERNKTDREKLRRTMREEKTGKVLGGCKPLQAALSILIQRTQISIQAAP